MSSPSDITKHSLYPVLVQILIDSLAEEGQVEVCLKECTIGVGDNPSLDATMLYNLQATKETVDSTKKMLIELEAQATSISGGEIIFETSPARKRPKGNKTRFSKETTSLLNDWLFKNEDRPFPTGQEKEALAASAGISVSQVSQWFTNARRRYLQTNKKM